MPSVSRNNAVSRLAVRHMVGDDTLSLPPGEGARFGSPTVDTPIRVTVAARSTLVNGQVAPTSTQTIFDVTTRVDDTLSGLTVAEGTADQNFNRNDPVASLITWGMIEAAGTVTTAPTGLLKGVSGALTPAVANTDYTPPDGIGSALTVQPPDATTAGTLAARFANRVDCKHDHGATGDGTTDDHAAITAAAAAAGEGGTVYFPPGTYALSSTLVPLAGQMWYGEGPGLTTLKLTGGGITVVTLGNAGATLYGLTLDGNGLTSGMALGVSGPDCRAELLTIVGGELGVRVVEGGDRFSLVNSHISDCRFSSPIEVNYAHHCHFEGNTLIATHDRGCCFEIYGRETPNLGVRIIGNYGTGPGVGAKLIACEGAVVQGNTFDGMGKEGIQLVNGEDVGGDEDFSTTPSRLCAVVGNTIKDCGHEGSGTFGVRLTTSFCYGNSVTGNTVDGSGLGGIAIEGAARNSVTGNVTTNNGGRGIGIFLTATGNVVSSNTVSGNIGGIALNNSDTNIVLGNLIDGGTAAPALSLVGCTDSTFIGNTLLGTVKVSDDGADAGTNFWRANPGAPFETIPGATNLGGFPGNLHAGIANSMTITAGLADGGPQWIMDYTLPSGGTYRFTSVDATYGRDRNTVVQFLKGADDPTGGYGGFEAVNHAGLLLAAYPVRPVIFMVNRTEVGRFTSTGLVAVQVAGSTTASADLPLTSTMHATKGRILLGANSAYDEVNKRLGINTQSPLYPNDTRGSGILSNWSNGVDQDFQVNISAGGAGDKRALLAPSTNTALAFGVASTEVFRVTASAATFAKPIVLPALADASIPDGGIAWSTDTPNAMKCRTPAGALKTITLT